MKLTYRRGQNSSDLEEGGEEGRSAWEASPGRLGGAGNIVCVRCTDRLTFSNSLSCTLSTYTLFCVDGILQ